jgi:hypothetical protein
MPLFLHIFFIYTVYTFIHHSFINIRQGPSLFKICGAAQGAPPVSLAPAANLIPAANVTLVSLTLVANLQRWTQMFFKFTNPQTRGLNLQS